MSTVSMEPENLASLSAEVVSAQSALVQLNRELEDAERRLRLTLDVAGAAGSWEWNIAENRLVADARFAALTGQDPVALAAGVPARAFFTGIHPEDVQRIRLSVAAILAGAEVFSKDYRLVGPDGATRWVHADGRTLLDESDAPRLFEGIIIDVTDQRRTQEQLRIAQDAGGIGTFEHSDGFGTVAVSSQFCRLLGLHPTSILPVRTINVLVHPDDRPIIEPELPSEPKPQRNIEFRVYRADTGERRWLARRGEYVPDLVGGRLRYIGVLYDVTEAKQKEEQLHTANAALADLVRERTRERNRVWEASRDILAVTDADGVFRDVNPAWEATFGAPTGEVVGRKVSDFVRAEDRDVVRAGLGQAWASGAAEFETESRHEDGSPRWISWVASRDDGLIYVFGRNITQDRQQAEMLRQTEAQLRQSQKMEAVGQLTGGIAHDFNNLLTGIIGSLDILKRRIAARRYDDVERFMDAATTSAQRAAALTHRLLAFSRQQSLERKPIDAGELIGSMEELLRRTLGEQVELNILVAPDAWTATTDANQLENALLNLAINARDAMPSGGTLSIEVRNVGSDHGEAAPPPITGRTGDFLSIIVRDTGIGMPPSVIEKAFDPFFTTKPIGQGTGLGLSMVYGFAAQSGGSVRIDSVLGEGTTVTLFLPRGVDKHASGRSSDAALNAPHGDGETVLVVEDDPAVRLLVVDVLTDLGYRPIEATTASEAIPILQSGRHIDLLISDVGLPGMNGRQLAEIAGRLLPDLRILLMTGYAASARNRDDFLGAGMALISKPFDLDQLAQKIREMLAN